MRKNKKKPSVSSYFFDGKTTKNPYITPEKQTIDNLPSLNKSPKVAMFLGRMFSSQFKQLLSHKIKFTY
jgi:hypothetical protein